MLGLKVSTDAGWAAAAMHDADAVLIDHAHCELKAASNALSLVARHAGRDGDAALSQALTELAREEIEHFQRVLAVLAARGVAVGPPPVDAYAAALRRAATELPRQPGITVLVDRLLVGALIEARSCERFQLLSEAALGGDDELHALWRELLASEARHYRTFVDLAVRAAGGQRACVADRLERLAEAEAAIVVALANNGGEVSRATIHG
jgi:tRNA 2-(methylsulfanyl)-N6-isopentenyladenosine37 hydroxylase